MTGHAAAPARPAHLDPALVALVVLGGAVGTGARYGLALAFPAVGGWPVATLVANVVGAFCLGALLEALVRRGPETPGLRRVRLAVGTGVMGGLTTFSSLAFEIERLAAGGDVGQALAYALATLVLGVLACVGGVAVAAGRSRRTEAGA